jgi:signal peptidase I
MQKSLPSSNGQPRSSNGQRPSALAVGQPVADPGTESVLTFEEGEPNLGTQRVTARSKRRADYRLRGLDLEAQKTSHAPTVPVRNNQVRNRRRRRLIIGWVMIAAMATGVSLLLRATVLEPFSVPSAGMAPTLQTGDRIIVLKSRFLADPIERGSIVVFRQPKPDTCDSSGANAQNLVQRVVGMPGQTIWSVGDTIYVDGRRLRDDSPANSKAGQARSKPIPFTTVPAGEYFVMGDNHAQSCDSRTFGAIPASSIVGKVVSIVLRGGHPYIHVF